MKKNPIELAQEGFRKKDIKIAKKAHTKQKIAETIHGESHQTEAGAHIGDFVYGALDGLITTFAVVAGVEGANLPSAVILILGFANLVADGFSMGLGAYLSSKSEKEYEEHERAREMWEVENIPKEEREEIRQIFIKKGFKEPLLEKVVEVITSNKTVWVETMLTEELKIFPEKKSPAKKAIVTFLAFLLVGLTPLIPYLLATLLQWNPEGMFLISIVLTGGGLFVVGGSRSFLIAKKWWVAGLEMFLVGALAAVLAYTVGALLQGIA